VRSACAIGVETVGVRLGVGVLVMGKGVLVGIRVGTFAPSVADGTMTTTVGVFSPLHAVIVTRMSRSIVK
jgi:sugar phosphate permease